MDGDLVGVLVPSVADPAGRSRSLPPGGRERPPGGRAGRGAGCVLVDVMAAVMRLLAHLAAMHHAELDRIADTKAASR